MTTPKRIAILALSVGWIVPLTVAFFIGRGFAWFTYQVASGLADPVPWHPFEWISRLFLISMLWLACAMVFWILKITDDR